MLSNLINGTVYFRLPHTYYHAKVVEKWNEYEVITLFNLHRPSWKTLLDNT